jgi:excisionase family DNA binding protein
VAEILDMHHKTIRAFITDRKLRASKVGKQWRISEEDLNSFLDNKKASSKEDEFLEFSTKETTLKEVKSKISVSTVIDIEEIEKEQYMRISNMLLAVINGKDSTLPNSTINIKYYEMDKNLKILLWGDISFIEEMLSIITMLTDTSNSL